MFVRAVAPFTPLGSSSVSRIVGRAARRAGLGTVHGHRLRHTAASETLNAAAGLDEVAQLLRHDGVANTVTYAKVERTRLTAPVGKRTLPLNPPLGRASPPFHRLSTLPEGAIRSERARSGTCGIRRRLPRNV